jgi:hypothetical protein
VACHYDIAERFDEAIAHFTEVVAGYEHLLGPEHPDTQSYRNGLAFLLQRAGRPGEAITFLARNLAEQEHRLGPGHPTTEATRASITRLHPPAP